MTKQTDKETATRGLSRRAFLKASAGTAALVGALQTNFSTGVHIAEAAGPEVTKAILGYIALIDASPLVIAKEKGLFAKHGMPDVEVAKAGVLGRDARQHRAWLREERHRRRAHSDADALSDLGRQGDAEQRSDADVHPCAAQSRRARRFLSRKEYKDLKVTTDASPLKAAFARKKAEGKEVKIAMTFPGGTHDLWLRYWLAAGGIDPDKDVSTIVVPPPQMVANMKVGNMDAFCVGEPWNEQLVNQGIGFTACTTGEIWFKHPEKALGMRAEWVDKYPNAAKALLMAVHGSAAMVREDGEQGGARRNRRQAPVVQRAGRQTSSAASRATSITATAASPRAPSNT